MCVGFSIKIHVMNSCNTGIQVSEHGVFSLGSAVSITCSSDFGVQSIDWLHGKEVISTTMGSQGELRIESVSESDHGQQYTCRATTSFGVQEHNITIQVEGTDIYLIAILLLCYYC